MKNNTFTKTLAIFLALSIVIFTALTGCKKDNDEPVDNPATETTTVTPDNTEDTTDKEEIQDNNVNENETKETETSEEKTETNEDETEITTKPSQKETNKVTENKEMSKEEIVKLYNTSVNRVKKEAKSLTRNYKKLSSLEKYLKLPSAIQSLGKSAMEMFVKGTDKPQTWTKKEDIKIIFPVGKQDFSSHLTTDMVEKATCKDNGKTYEISLKLYDDKITSPAIGKGYAGVFNTVTASVFKEINIPTVTYKTVNVNGINGSITCTIEKSSGRVIKANYKNTDILYLGVKVAFSEFDVQFALSAEEDYTIKY